MTDFDRIQPLGPEMGGPTALEGAVDVTFSAEVWTDILTRWVAPDADGRTRQLVEDVVYNLPPRILNRSRVTVPAGFLSDGPTFTREALLGAALFGVPRDSLDPAAWLHDYLLWLIASGTAWFSRAQADDAFAFVASRTPGLDADDAREATLGVRLQTARAERAAGPVARLALSAVPAIRRFAPGAARSLVFALVRRIL